MVKVVSKKEIEEIVRLKDEELLSFQDIGKQLNLGADTVSRFYNEEVRKRKTEAEKVEKEDLAASEKREKPYKTLATNKTVSFDPSALAVIEQLKKKGIFNDMDEAVNKALEMMAAQTNNPKYVDFLTKGGEIQMPEQEPNPEKKLKEMQVTDLIEAQIKKKNAESEALVNKVKSGEANPSSFMPLLQEQLAMKQMQRIMKDINQEEKTEESNPLKEMKEMMMMQVYGNMMQPHKGNGESLQLQGKIDDLQKQIHDQGILSEIKKITDSSKGQSMNAEDYIKFFADKHVSIEKEKLETEKARNETQKEREKRIEDQNNRNQEATNMQMQALHKQLNEAQKGGSGIEEITKLKDKIQTIKEVAKEFGVQEKEKSTGELASELVLGLAERLKEPISHATKGFAAKMETEKIRSQGQPVYVNQPGTSPPSPTPVTPMPSNPGPSNPEPVNSSESIQPSEPTVNPISPEAVQEITPAPDEDIVNTFSEQNTTKKSAEKPSTGG